MARPRTIDRNKLLDAAEAVVIEAGAVALTIDSVAKRAGVTKSGVQHSFGTKQQLIDAMFDRWETEFTQEVERRTGPDPNPIARVCGDIEVTMNADEADTARSAALMAVLVQTPEQRKRAQRWYHDRMEQLDLMTEEGRHTRLAFLASEALFMLRSFELISLAPGEWENIFADILALQAGMLQSIRPDSKRD